MKKFLIKSLGCKVNAYESEFVRNLLLDNNYEEVYEKFENSLVKLPKHDLDAYLRKEIMNFISKLK